MCKTSAVNLTVIKRVLCRMTEKEQADVVLSRKAVFVRCCLKYKAYKAKILPLSCQDFRFGGGGRIRTTEAEATDLQSAPFDRSGTPPKYEPANCRLFLWSWWTDSNSRPADYKSAALPTELHQHSTALSQRTGVTGISSDFDMIT